MTRILIVDDKEENLYYLRALLTGHGYAVDSARHGAEALVKARQNLPQLVISDLLMPVMDGYTLLSQWKADARLRDSPFIVYTATYTDVEDERLALQLGADAFILKPSEPEDFLARIKEVQARVKTGEAVAPKQPSVDEQDNLKLYSETLIRKLEEKTQQLEETNRALQRDVAERKQTEISLRESEERFRQLAENINELFWITNPGKQEIVYLSPAFEKIWGRPCLDIGCSLSAWLQMIHPDDRARMADAIRKKQRLGTYDETYRILRPDGSTRWVRDRAFPVLDHTGQCYRLVGTAEDVTESRRTEGRFRHLVESNIQGIFFWKKGCGITEANEAFLRMIGHTAEDVAAGELRLDRITPPEYADADARAARQIAERGVCEPYEKEYVRKDGRRVTVLLGSARFADDPDEGVGFAVDRTERKKLEQQFLRVQRMEGIGTLAGGIAHDLNNVLGPIIMSLELLEMHFRDAASRELLAVIGASARRGADMVRQVLSFARGVEGRRVQVQVKHLIQEIERIANDTFLKHIRVHISIARDLAVVHGDPTQIHQVLLNLCLNARDAMPKGGALHISAENIVLDEQYAASNIDAHPGPYIVIEVEDNGLGISSEILDKIFDPFFTTKEVGKGTGLGLSTAQAIVKSHRGFIRVSSEAGRGTKFQVYLPAYTGPEQETALPAPTKLPRGNGERVLVIDDEAAVREITRQTLESFGYRVLLAPGGSEAVTAFAANWTDIALVITDMMMPHMDGSTVIQILRKIDPAVRIIGTSGLAANNATMALGVKQFLMKPCTAEVLLGAVRQALDEK